MTVHRLDVAWPDARVPRMHPCQAAGLGPHAAACGATPASRWRRSCGNGHVRDCWLCGSHAAVITGGNGGCAECADKGVTSPALLEPVTMLLAR
jgi:hypothetical protein